MAADASLPRPALKDIGQVFSPCIFDWIQLVAYRNGIGVLLAGRARWEDWVVESHYALVPADYHSKFAWLIIGDIARNYTDHDYINSITTSTI